MIISININIVFLQADEQLNNTASTSVAIEMNALSYLFIELIHKAWH